MKLQKKAFIAGGSLSEIPLIQACLLEGYYVITSGNNKDDVGHSLSHEYVYADYSNRNELHEVVNNLKPQIILSGANDFSYLSCTYVAEKLNYRGFDNFETAIKLHHKDQFVTIANKLGLPRAQSFVSNSTSFEQAIKTNQMGIRFPILVKPIDLTGGKGIQRIDSIADLNKIQLSTDWFLTKSKQVVIEEFFDGSLHSYSTIIYKGKVAFEHIDNEYGFYNSYLVSTSETTSKIPDRLLKELRDATETLVSELNLIDGVLHCQFMFNGDRFIILEYTRRMSGDLYSLVINRVHSCRHDLVFLRQSQNSDLFHSVGILPNTFQKPRNPWVSRHCFTTNLAKQFNGITINNKIEPYVTQLFLSKKWGQWLDGDGRGKVGTCILEYPTEELMNEFTSKICHLMEVL